ITDRVGRDEDDHHSYTVKARVLLLAGGWAVAVSGDDDSTVRIVEPDLSPEQRIQELLTADVQAGDYILLRTHGGGELISALADYDLGIRAAALRETQRRWKMALVASVANS